MPAATLTVGDVEITPILDVDTSIPLAEVFDGSGDPPPGGSESLAARYPDKFTAEHGTSATIASWSARRRA